MNTSENVSRGPYRIYTPSSLGEAVRHYRLAAGLTQSELAEQAGLHRPYLAKLETGMATEQLQRLFRVYRLLGVRMTIDRADW